MSWYSPAVKVARVSSCFVFYNADVAPALLPRLVVDIVSGRETLERGFVALWQCLLARQSPRQV
jgi:hypothetical protein